MVVENSIHGYDRQNDHVRRIGDYLGPDFNCDALTNFNLFSTDLDPRISTAAKTSVHQQI